MSDNTLPLTEAAEALAERRQEYERALERLGWRKPSVIPLQMTIFEPTSDGVDDQSDTLLPPPP